MSKYDRRNVVGAVGCGPDRRDFLHLMAGGAAAAAVSLPGLSFAQDKVVFRMDKIDAIHYHATHFVPQFLTMPIEWNFSNFGSSGFARVSAFTRKSIDGFATAWSYLAAFTAEGVDGTAVCGVGGGGTRLLAAKGRDEIQSLSDLKGKKVGVVQFSSQDIMLIYALKNIGIDPFKEVERLNLGNPAGVIAAMARGDVDACVIWEPSASIVMLTHGARMVSDLAAESFGYSNGGLYIRDSLIQERPDVVQDIVSATVKATDYILANKGVWEANARKVTGQSAEVVAAAVANCQPSVSMPMNTIRAVTRSLYELGIRPKDYSDAVGKNVNYTFLEKATGKSKEELGYVA